MVSTSRTPLGRIQPRTLRSEHRGAAFVLWAGRGGLPRFYPDVLEAWRPWAPDVRGRALDASHFLAEDRPEDTAAHLLSFLVET